MIVNQERDDNFLSRLVKSYNLTLVEGSRINLLLFTVVLQKKGS